MTRFCMFPAVRCCLLLMLISCTPVLAAIDEYEFSSEQEQASFKKLTSELRCPKCLNANLAGSDAPIAADLRAEIYDQLQAGRSEEEIIDFMRDRYGDFILYRPPVSPATSLLWFGPAVLLIAGFLLLRRAARGSHENRADALSDEERSELARVLEQEKGK